MRCACTCAKWRTLVTCGARTHKYDILFGRTALALYGALLFCAKPLSKRIAPNSITHKEWAAITFVAAPNWRTHAYTLTHTHAHTHTQSLSQVHSPQVCPQSPLSFGLNPVNPCSIITIAFRVSVNGEFWGRTTSQRVYVRFYPYIGRV